MPQELSEEERLRLAREAAEIEERLRLAREAGSTTPQRTEEVVSSSPDVSNTKNETFVEPVGEAAWKSITQSAMLSTAAGIGANMAMGMAFNMATGGAFGITFGMARAVYKGWQAGHKEFEASKSDGPSYSEMAGANNHGIAWYIGKNIMKGMAVNIAFSFVGGAAAGAAFEAASYLLPESVTEFVGSYFGASAAYAEAPDLEAASPDANMTMLPDASEPDMTMASADDLNNPSGTGVIAQAQNGNIPSFHPIDPGSIKPGDPGYYMGSSDNILKPTFTEDEVTISNEPNSSSISPAFTDDQVTLLAGEAEVDRPGVYSEPNHEFRVTNISADVPETDSNAPKFTASEAAAPAVDPDVVEAARASHEASYGKLMELVENGGSEADIDAATEVANKDLADFEAAKAAAGLDTPDVDNSPTVADATVALEVDDIDPNAPNMTPMAEEAEATMTPVPGIGNTEDVGIQAENAPVPTSTPVAEMSVEEDVRGTGSPDANPVETEPVALSAADVDTSAYEHLSDNQKVLQIEQATKIIGLGDDVKWDGRMDAATETAIKEMLAEKGVTIDGSITDADLDKVHALVLEQSKARITELQEMLNEKFNAGIPTTGNAGPQTLEALREAARTSGIPNANSIDWDDLPKVMEQLELKPQGADISGSIAEAKSEGLAEDAAKTTPRVSHGAASAINADGQNIAADISGSHVDIVLTGDPGLDSALKATADNLSPREVAEIKSILAAEGIEVPPGDKLDKVTLTSFIAVAQENGVVGEDLSQFPSQAGDHLSNLRDAKIAAAIENGGIAEQDVVTGEIKILKESPVLGGDGVGTGESEINSADKTSGMVEIDPDTGKVTALGGNKLGAGAEFDYAPDEKPGLLDKAEGFAKGTGEAIGNGFDGAIDGVKKAAGAIGSGMKEIGVTISGDVPSTPLPEGGSRIRNR